MNLDEPAVSVVIPVWDSYVRWLTEAVQSVVTQATAAEVIVVDNASEVEVPVLDGTTVVRSDRRLTSGAARNLGLASVTSPLVVFLDGDDVMLPGSLAALVEGIAARPDAVAFTMAMVDGDTGKRHRAPRRLARTLARMPRVFALAHSVWSLLPTQGATILRTDDVVAAGGYADRSQGEDWVLGVSLAWRGRVHFDPRPALVYRWHRESPGRGGEVATLRENARCVRGRLRADAGIPRGVRPLVPLIAVGQVAAIMIVRPLWRGLRDAVGRKRNG